MVHVCLAGSVAPPNEREAFIWTKLFQYSQNVVPTLLSSFWTCFQFAYISFAQPEAILNFMRFPSFVISTSLFLCLLSFALPLLHVLSRCYLLLSPSFYCCLDFLSIFHYFLHPHFPQSLVSCPPFINTPLHFFSHLPGETN